MDVKKIKIVVADADNGFSVALKNILAERGFESVKVITDFPAFSDTVLSYRPDVIIMDVILPGTDGLYFIKNLRSHFDIGFSPEIIISSAFYNERCIKESSALGVYSYFIKPVSLSVVADAVCQISGHSSASRSEPYLSFGKSSFSLLEEPVVLPTADPVPAADSVSSQRRRIVKITQLLHDMGIPAHLCGHDYLRDAIMMVMDSHEISGRMTKEIYPEIANKYKKSPQSVERAIRTALDVAWTRGKTELINDIFRFTVNIQKGRPTNSEFVSLIADYLNYDCMSAV